MTGRDRLTQEHHETGACFNHVAQGRPGCDGQGTCWGYICVRFDTAIGEGSVEEADVHVIAVCEEHGNYFVWVRIQPAFDRCQVPLDATSIFQEAAGVTEAQLLEGI